MRFPDVPTCHANAPFAAVAPALWRPPQEPVPQHCELCGQVHLGTYVQPFRTCYYCGSIHPQDLLHFADDPVLGVTMHGSDWKYGWPHKHYVEGIPNPIAGQPAGISHRSLERTAAGGPRFAVEFSPAPETTFAKWYNDHLGDEGYDDDAWATITALLRRLTGIAWEMRDGGLRYSAPYTGYQR